MEASEWRLQAVCAQVDTELFFPQPLEIHKINKAKAICARCPVSAECLEDGMAANYGIWGGLTASERTKLRNKNRRAVA